MKELKKAIGTERLAGLHDDLVPYMESIQEYLEFEMPPYDSLDCSVMDILLTLLDDKLSRKPGRTKNGYKTITVQRIGVEHYLPWSSATTFQDDELQDIAFYGATHTRLVGSFVVDGVPVQIGSRFISHPFWQYCRYSG